MTKRAPARRKQANLKRLGYSHTWFRGLEERTQRFPDCGLFLEDVVWAGHWPSTDGPTKAWKTGTSPCELHAARPVVAALAGDACYNGRLPPLGGIRRGETARREDPGENGV